MQELAPSCHRLRFSDSQVPSPQILRDIDADPCSEELTLWETLASLGQSGQGRPPATSTAFNV